MHLSVAYDFLPRRHSANASIVMDHFGVGFDTGRHVIAEGLELPIEPGDVVCFTGASGSGKSSLLRAAIAELRRASVTAAGQRLSEKGDWLPDLVPEVASDHQMDGACPPFRTASQQGGDAGVLDINTLDPGERLVIDALKLPAGEAMRLLSACGLGEAQLMLRTPDELSDGQRYRFRLALAAARLAGRTGPRWIVADEFTSTLDRTLAKVIADNVRRLADRTGLGFLVATAHEDILEDLAPSLHVVCRLDGRIEWRRGEAGGRCQAEPGGGAFPGGAWERGQDGAWERGQERAKKMISIARRLFLTIGSRRDWPYFSRWHYRGHRLPAVRFVTLLWDAGDEALVPALVPRLRLGTQVPMLCIAPAPATRSVAPVRSQAEPGNEGARGHPRSSVFHPQPRTPTDPECTPIGICVFTAPPLSLRERNRFFGLSARWSRLKFQALNRQLVTLARVVLHPTYRGAGLAPAFVRRSCELCPWPWIETQAQMGHLNPFFEKAGFVRVGVSTRKSPTRRDHSSIYGTKAHRHAAKSLVTPETFEKSRYARPVYYVFDNRGNARRRRSSREESDPDARSVRGAERRRAGT